MSFLTLDSKDGVQITISREAARFSEVMKDMMEALPEEECDLPVPITEIDAATLTKVVEWCEHHREDKEEGEVFDIKTLPPFEKQFLDLSQADLSNLVYAANFLGIELLFEYSCEAIAQRIKDMTTEQMREYFGIVNDFTQEEIDEILKLDGWAEEFGDEVPSEHSHC
ncbi:E3 ubiquitin ligase SCF complex, Skp subunit [Hypoxylon fuscum]|nr:E3 ubiquitin ligase SCF complex, Skp subunit [Hypoxylon fuscum]